MYSEYKNEGIALVFSCLVHALLLLPLKPAGEDLSVLINSNRDILIVGKLAAITPSAEVLQHAQQPHAEFPKPEIAATRYTPPSNQTDGQTDSSSVDNSNEYSTDVVLDVPDASANGLSGLLDIVYWPFEEVDQGASMLAQLPEKMVISPWPSERPVQVEVWVNPDGSLASLNFPQEDLPVSVKAVLSDAIRQYGFTPALKNGLPVGNRRALELFLIQTTVPALVSH